LKLVVDSSVALKWFLADQPGEEDVAEAIKVLSRIYRKEVAAIQPIHWCAEVLGVLARVRPDQIDIMAHLLDDVSFRVEDGWNIYRTAAKLSVELNHHIFDTLYHAVALEHGAEFITADKKYFNKARELGSITLLG